MLNQLQPIDGAYYTSLYFLATTGIILIGVIAWMWRRWEKWEIEDERERRFYRGR